MRVFEYRDYVKREVNPEVWNFPGGEIGVKMKIHEPSSSFTVEYTDPKNDNILVLLNTLDCLKQQGVDKRDITVFMPYLPYARQDRVCHEGESFALDVFLRVLATGHFGALLVYDLHSSVSVSLIREHLTDVLLLHVPQHSFIVASTLWGFDYIVAPDKGSEKKAKTVAAATSTRLIQMYKTRVDSQVIYTQDETSGTIQYKGKALVVDDICDGGATFLALAKVLKDQNPELELSLYVTHGIFSKGVEELLKNYDTIYTSNLINKSVSNQVKEV
jgi:ribose-phosphate pyrophosphokinase